MLNRQWKTTKENSRGRELGTGAGGGGRSAQGADCIDCVVASRMCTCVRVITCHTHLTTCHLHFCKLTKRMVPPKDWGAPGMLAWMCASPDRVPCGLSEPQQMLGALQSGQICFPQGLPGHWGCRESKEPPLPPFSLGDSHAAVRGITLTAAWHKPSWVARVVGAQAGMLRGRGAGGNFCSGLPLPWGLETQVISKGHRPGVSSLLPILFSGWVSASGLCQVSPWNLTETPIPAVPLPSPTPGS